MVVFSLSEAGDDDVGSKNSGFLLKLQQARLCRHDRALSFQHISFSDDLVQAVVELLGCDGRKWELISFDRCSGSIHIFLFHVLQLRYVHALELIDAGTSTTLDSSSSNTAGSSSIPSFSSSANKPLGGAGGGAYFGQAFNTLLNHDTSLNKLRLRVGFSETFPILPPEFVLQIHPSLYELDISGMWLGGGANVPALATALERNRTLRIVRLKFFASLDDADISKLVTALEHNPSLQGLEIGQYDSGSISLAAIATLLDRQQQEQHEATSTSSNRHGLSWLRIRHQALRHDQVADLSPLTTILAKNSSLTFLDLSLTTVSDAAMEELGRALHVNTTLRDLFLNHCSISSASIQSFCGNHLPHMKGLKTLDLTGNHLEHGELQRAKELILEGVRSNWELEHISLQAGDCILSKEIGYFLDLNRSGRQLLNSYGGANNELYIPSSLWPIVLERADKKIMLRVANDGPADRRERRASVLYFLLREHVLLERRCR
jgi:Ran GTPase-activating protein (RanGAP) involved in mRNA processing and transport